MTQRTETMSATMTNPPANPPGGLDCPACGAGPLKPRFRMSDFTIGVCPRCGLHVNQTFYSDARFRESLFQPEYYDTNVAFEHRQQAWSDDPSLPFYSGYLEQIEQQIGVGRVLDVGCAFGNFLKLAQSRGWAPSGVELSPYSSAAARETWGFDVFTGDLNGSPFADESFDLVTFWDVIEHVPSPHANLERARKLLRTGGRVLLATDNAEGLIAKLGGLLYDVTGGLFSYPVRKFFIRFNSCTFTKANLGRLLERTGFRVVSAEQIDYPLSKLNVAGAERCLVWGLYSAGRVVNRRSQFLIVAEAV